MSPGAPALAASLLLLAACGPGGDPADRRLFEAKCGRCHGIEVPLARRHDPAGWRRTVWAMRQRGADLTDDEAERVVRYLSATRGP